MATRRLQRSSIRQLKQELHGFRSSIRHRDRNTLCNKTNQCLFGTSLFSSKAFYLGAPQSAPRA
eukprot:3478810-Amphidinium_carterae.1